MRERKRGEGRLRRNMRGSEKMPTIGITQFHVPCSNPASKRNPRQLQISEDCDMIDAETISS